MDMRPLVKAARRQWRMLLRQYRRWRTLGTRGERAAARYLRRRGFQLVQRQAKTIYGEIDIIAVEDRTVVFVEVKTRSSHDAGHPAEAVNRDKQRRLTRLALAFLRHHDLLEHGARFDVVAVTWPPNKWRPRIEHYRNAFEPDDKFQLFS
jgi:putative endonuclease